MNSIAGTARFVKKTRGVIGYFFVALSVDTPPWQ